MWNFGSLLGLILFIQLISGVIISFHYLPCVSVAFSSVVEFCENVKFGWLIRSIHSNGASFFFIFLFAHIGRGLFYKSYDNFSTWFAGGVILLLSMGTAFLGYVLPWGQMSFWGATVITNLLSVFPFGEGLVKWVWGGFSIGGPTLSRFFSIHYILPFIISSVALVHILFLHENGSQNPLGVSLSSYKISFHPAYTLKDLLGFLLFFILFFSVCVLFPDLFMDPDNFLEANSMVTPPHIQPEWYFLFAYAILRSVPSKVGGVILLLSSVLVLFILPFLSSKTPWKKGGFFFWFFVVVFLLLTWVGSMPVDPPFIKMGQLLSFLYFSLILTLPSFFLGSLWKNFLLQKESSNIL